MFFLAQLVSLTIFQLLRSDAFYDRGFAFRLKWFLNDGASLTQNRRKCCVLRYRGSKVYRFLAEMVSE